MLFVIRYATNTTSAETGSGWERGSQNIFFMYWEETEHTSGGNVTAVKMNSVQLQYYM